jgi:hypothetical protein
MWAKSDVPSGMGRERWPAELRGLYPVLVRSGGLELERKSRDCISHEHNGAMYVTVMSAQ